jgi:antirestriction protein ArdC
MCVFSDFFQMFAGGEDHKIYAEEELVAEMAASFLNAHAGIMEAEVENSAAYLQGWINALKSKDAKSWIIRAASQAQKAAEFIIKEPFFIKK